MAGIAGQQQGIAREQQGIAREQQGIAGEQQGIAGEQQLKYKHTFSRDSPELDVNFSRSFA